MLAGLWPQSSEGFVITERRKSRNTGIALFPIALDPETKNNKAANYPSPETPVLVMRDRVG
jgi:hypothetical protein